MRIASLLVLVACLVLAVPAAATEEQCAPATPEDCAKLEGKSKSDCEKFVAAQAKPPQKAPAGAKVNTLEDIYAASFVDLGWLRAYMAHKRPRPEVDPSLIAWEVVD